MSIDKLQTPFTVLVTGSTGFLGGKVVETLLMKGFHVRGLVRKTSNVEKIRKQGVEISVGDVADLDSLKSAFDSVDYVVHAAADTAGTVNGGMTNTLQGTKNILSLCKEFKVKKLIYISSCSVYAVANYNKGESVTEKSILEPLPASRGPYSHAKILAEEIVLKAMNQGDYPIVCLRPGTIYGPGGELYSPMMGFSYKRKIFITIGSEGFVLPFIYLDNIAEAVSVAISKEESCNRVYNVVDPYQLSKTEYVERVLKKIYPKAFFLTLPYSILYVIVALQEKLFLFLRKKPILTRYRLKSSQNQIVYDGQKIYKELHWVPQISQDVALQSLIEFELKKKE